jgi:hypothetical protein
MKQGVSLGKLYFLFFKLTEIFIYFAKIELQ